MHHNGRRPPGPGCPGRSQATSGWRSTRCLLPNAGYCPTAIRETMTPRAASISSVRIRSRAGQLEIVWRVPTLVAWSLRRGPSAVARLRRSSRSSCRADLCKEGSEIPSQRAAATMEGFSDIAIRPRNCGLVILLRIASTFCRPVDALASVSSDKAARIWSKNRCTRGKRIAPGSVTKHPECRRSNCCVANRISSAWTDWVNAGCDRLTSRAALLKLFNLATASKPRSCRSDGTSSEIIDFPVALAGCDQFGWGPNYALSIAKTYGSPQQFNWQSTAVTRMLAVLCRSGSAKPLTAGSQKEPAMPRRAFIGRSRCIPSTLKVAILSFEF